MIVMKMLGFYLLLLFLNVIFIVFATSSHSTAVTDPFIRRPRQKQYTNRVNETHHLHSYNAIDQVEYRLTRLEVQVAEKSETIRSELRDTNRRMQALEWQNAEIRSSLDGLKGEISRFTEQSHIRYSESSQNENDKLEERVENLVRGVQLVVAALRGLTFDINTLKTNISTLLNKTDSMYEMSNHLVTKRFFNNGIAEIKNERVYNSRMCVKNEITETAELVPKNCKEIKDKGEIISGIYKIKPQHSDKTFMVYCDMQTSGGGWTLIQNRYDGSEDFYLNWHDYKYGFGNIGGEFWLGLENIYHLTGFEINELYIELQDMVLEKVYAHYAAFSLGSEMEGYPLKVLGGYQGTAGDSLLYHAGSRFSTKDMDQDSWPEGSCAQAHNGAWWYRACDKSNLNGRYLSGDLPDEYIYQGMYWGDFKGPKYSLLTAKMMVRPRGFSSPKMNFDNQPKSNISEFSYV